MALPMPKFEDSYDLGETLGRGKFAVVRMATHRESGEKYAVKIIDKRKLGKETWRARQEVEMLRSISHRNILAFVDYLDGTRYSYVVTELCRGGELFDAIVRRKNFSERDAAKIFTSLVEAVGHLHSNGIVHRDIKPENILLSDNEEAPEVKLADLGMSTLLSDKELLAEPCGTPGYVAPEVLKNFASSDAVDMWALGVVLYMMLCGFSPFAHRDEYVTRDLILEGRYSFSDPVWDEVSDAARDLIRHLIVVDPVNRYSCEEVLEHHWLQDASAQNLSQIIPSMAGYNTARKQHRVVPLALRTDLLSVRKDAVLGHLALHTVGSMSGMPLHWRLAAVSPSGESMHGAGPRSRYFGSLVFGLPQLRQHLPSAVFSELVKQMSGVKQCSMDTFTSIAHAVKEWAISHGVTHYVHTYHPLGSYMAEKHDTFLQLTPDPNYGKHQIGAVDQLSASQLIWEEDASFKRPAARGRDSFEGRGYTAWDTGSSMYILAESEHSPPVLVIPSVLYGATGESLDDKSVLLRSTEALKRACHLYAESFKSGAHRKTVRVILQVQQDFFLADDGACRARPDLSFCGHLVGGRVGFHNENTASSQRQVPTLAETIMNETEMSCCKLGIVVQSRATSNAVGQYEVEVAPEDIESAVDHNILMMKMLRNIAHKHKMRALFHGKPFAHCTGSGRTCTWTLQDGDGNNMLEQPEDAATNIEYLSYMAAILHAVHNHANLLLSTCIHSGNIERLENCEDSPPAVMFVSVTPTLDAIVRNLTAGTTGTTPPALVRQRTSPVLSHADEHTMGVPTVPLSNLTLDASAVGNSTAPVQYTGSGMEFRLPAANTRLKWIFIVFNTAVADCLDRIRGKLSRAVALSGGNTASLKEQQMAVLRKEFAACRDIIYNGSAYDPRFQEVQESRQLAQYTSFAACIQELISTKSKALFSAQGVLMEDELHHRCEYLYEDEAKTLMMSAGVVGDMVKTRLLPVIFAHRANLARLAVKQQRADASMGLPKPEKPPPHVLQLREIDGLLKQCEELMVDMEKATGMCGADVPAYQRCEILDSKVT